MLRVLARIGVIAGALLLSMAAAVPEEERGPQRVEVDLRTRNEQGSCYVSFLRRNPWPGHAFVAMWADDPATGRSEYAAFGLYPKSPVAAEVAAIAWGFGEVPAEIQDEVLQGSLRRVTDELVCRVDRSVYLAADRVRASWAESAEEGAQGYEQLFRQCALFTVEVARTVGLEVPPGWRNSLPDALIDGLIEAAGADPASTPGLVGSYRVKWNEMRAVYEERIRERHPPSRWAEELAAIEAGLRSRHLSIRSDGTWATAQEGGWEYTGGTWSAHGAQLTLTRTHRNGESVGTPDAVTGTVRDGELHAEGGGATGYIWEKAEGADVYAPIFPPAIAFDRAEWETNEAPRGIGDPRAKKGGTIVLALQNWPRTIRTEGPDSRFLLLNDVHDMIYESLLDYSMEIGGCVPGLASHWRLLDDRRTLQFRIDPEARWADGRPVTADDVVATIEHLQNPDRKDPLVQEFWEQWIDNARVLDKYTVEIQSKEALWRNMTTIGAGMPIYPAAYIRMAGDTYLEEWNWRLPPGTGPYEIRPEGIQEGHSITLNRRAEYWSRHRPEVQGLYNFDAIVWRVVRDRELAYQKLLKGDLDMYRVGRARRWVDELDDEERIQRGWIQMRKIHSKAPLGYGGFCFNLRKPPFDSRNVRLAFAHMFNREKLFAEVLYNQYEYIDSYFPGQVWAREDARRVRFEPKRARELLAADGWVERDAEGWLVNAQGERFEKIVMEYGAPAFLRIFKVVQDDLWNEAGIRLELKWVDGATLLRNAWEYEFKLIFWSWTAGLFPDPVRQFHSRYADPKQTNNLNGFKNEEVDQIVTEYQAEFDPARRMDMLHRLDEILFDEHLYALGWYAPFFRVLYWDKFGHPPEYVARYTRGWANIITYWWYDPDRHEALERARSADRDLYPDDADHQYDDLEPDWWRSHVHPMPR